MNAELTRAVADAREASLQASSWEEALPVVPTVPNVVNHYHAAPVAAPSRAGTAASWAVAVALASGVLVTAAVAAVAVAAALLSLAACALVLRGVWNSLRSGS